MSRFKISLEFRYCIILILAVFAYHDFLFADAVSATTPGCNNGVVVQLPAPNQNVFLGRQMFDGPGCTGRNPRVVQYSFDWISRKYTIQKSLVGPGDRLADGFTVAAAYDPDAAFFNNETWVSFECYLNGTETVSACVGPWSLGGGLDLTRTAALVNGNNRGEDADIHSASVPKLLVHNGSLYLFWSVVRMSPSHEWQDVTTRGMEIQVRSVGPGKLRVYPRNSDVAVSAMDPLKNVEVLGLASDPTSNTVADAFGFYSERGIIYATASVGGSDCLNKPSGINLNAMTPGCYRLGLFASRDPLVHRGFNLNKVDDRLLFGNGSGYTRIIVSPEGTRFFTSVNFSSSNPIAGSPLLPRGHWMYPAASWNEFFPAVESPKFLRRCDLSRLRTGGLLRASYQVALAYCLVLGRLPEAKGEIWWLAQLAAGLPAAQMTELVFDSVEFELRHKISQLNNEEYVKLLYRVFLAREAEPTGLALHVDLLNSKKLTRAQILKAIFYSQESRSANHLLF